MAKLKMNPNLKNDVSRKMSKGLNQAGYIMDTEARYRVAIDTGALRSSIGHITSFGEGTSDLNKPSGWAVRAGSNLVYAAANHVKHNPWGTNTLYAAQGRIGNTIARALK